jgi:hypothetical protein
MRTAIAAVAACACASFAYADSRPVTELAPDAAAYASLQDAARAAIAAALPLSSESEYGGVLIQCERGHYATEPVTSHNPKQVEYTARVPSGCTLAGLYHTHTGTDVGALKFSHIDVRNALKLRVPSFLGVRLDVLVRVFDPASMHAHLDPQRMYADTQAQGQIVGSVETSVVAADLRGPEVHAKAACSECTQVTQKQ